MTTDRLGHPLGDHRDGPPTVPVVPQETVLTPDCGHHCYGMAWDGPQIKVHCTPCHTGECAALDRPYGHAPACLSQGRPAVDYALGNPDSEQHCRACHCSCDPDGPTCGHYAGCPGC